MNKILQMPETLDPTFINPATNLPMIGSGTTGVDIGGSPFGLNVHEGLSPGMDHSTSAAFDDIFGPFR